MALVKCPECSNEISERALTCPSCGFPVSSKSEGPQVKSFRKRVLTGLLILFLLGLPICFVLKIPYVWILDIVGIIGAGITLFTMKE